MKKLMVKERLPIPDDTFEGSLEDIGKWVQKCKDEGWEGTEAESRGYDGARDFYLFRHREETDLEFNLRVKEQEKRQTAKRKQLLQKHKKLKEELTQLEDQLFTEEI